ncbi:MAG: hypothetical protein Q9203_005350 [Teloschistes exilis]
MFISPFQLTKSMHRELYPAIEPNNPAMSAENKVIIVTGAGRGLGAAVARVWTQAGAAGVILVGRKIESLNVTAQQISLISKTVTVMIEATDIINESSVQSLFSKVKARFDKVHVLVNSAGTMGQGGYVSVNWDVEEIESHSSEIREGKLTQLAFLNAKLSPEGHTWGSM